MKKIEKISVVMAAYNERGNVEELAIRINKILKKLKIKFEILYIIEGDDGSYESLCNLKRKIKQIKVYRPEKKGFGPAFKYGFQKISSDTTHVVTLDADLNHMPEELPRFIKGYKETGANIIIGSRLVEGADVCKRPFIKQFISELSNAVFPKVYGLDAKDITSGYRFLEIDVVKAVYPKIESVNFEFLAEFLVRAKKAGYTMREVPISFKPRIRGESKMDFFRTGFGYLKLTLKMVFVRYF
ncbi:MAG: glycosyltransferase [archaeon]